MNKSIYRPLHDKVIVKPSKTSEQMYGSIVIPDMGKEKAELGEVVAVGPGGHSPFGTFIPVSVKVGDLVLLPKIGPQRFEDDGEEFLIIADREILTVIEKTNE